MAEPEKQCPIKIVIAGKNPLLQSGLIKLFTSGNCFTLLVVAADGTRFLTAVGKLSLDVSLIGWEMPHLDGRGVLGIMRNHSNTPRMIVYTDSTNPNVPSQAMILGAAGFCFKLDPPG